MPNEFPCRLSTGMGGLRPKSFHDFTENSMYPLNCPTPDEPINPNGTGRKLFPASLVPGGAVITFFGQIHDWRLGWAGRIKCVLRLPLGDLVIHANRDTLPLELQNGSRVRVKLVNGQGDDPAMHVVSAVAAALTPSFTATTALGASS